MSALREFTAVESVACKNAGIVASRMQLTRAGRIANLVARTAVLAGSIQACGTPNPSDAGSSARATIGSAGGSIALNDVTLTVPPGALSEAVVITITRTSDAPPAGVEALSPIYRFEPEGLTFQSPAQVRIGFSGDASRASVWWSIRANAFDSLPSTVTATSATALVTHFSEGFVGAPSTDGGIDAGIDAVVDSTVDASDIVENAPVGDTGSDAVESGIDASTTCAGCARQLRPLNTARVSSWRPTLRWVLPAGATGGRVNLCRDRAMATGCRSFDVVGAAGRPAADLTPGVWFWRVDALNGSSLVSTGRYVWEFRVGYASAPTDSSYGEVADVNGDGLEDIVGGAALGCSGPPLEDTRAYVFLGSSAGISPTPSVSLQRAPVEQFGFSVSATDANGDGYTDLIVGSPWTNSDRGRIFVFNGGPTGTASAPTCVIDPPATGAVFGSMVTSLGDINGDGYGDVFVGGCTRTTSTSLTCSTEVWIYEGSAEGLANVPSIAYPTSMTSQLRIEAAGDVNGDGNTDLLFYYYLGSYSLHLGTPSGPDSAANRTWTVETHGVGDVNNDGYTDVIVANHADRTMGNGADLYLGSASGLGAAPAMTLVPTEWHSLAGLSDIADLGDPARSIGDFDGDGFGDVLLGNPLVNSGVAHVYRGNSSGLDSAPYSTIDIGNSVLITGITGGGDMNGDGLDDFAMASDWNNCGAPYISAFYGSRTDVPNAPSLRLQDGMMWYNSFGQSFAQYSRDAIGSFARQQSPFNGPGVGACRFRRVNSIASRPLS